MQYGDELAQRLAQDVVDGLRRPGSRLPAVRAMAAAESCAAGTVARAYRLLRSAAVITGPPRALAVVAPDGVLRARAYCEGSAPAPLTLGGSDDPVLDLLVRAANGRVVRLPSARGSLIGLGQLANGEADAAAIHLQHAASGRQNDPFVHHLVAPDEVVLIHLWRREQGLVVAPGNPHDIRSAADLAGRRLAWRGSGTGSRLVLARLLRDAGLVPRPADGETVASHLAVAAAVATGAVDAGLAVRAAADAVDAEFVPLTVEAFELAVPAAKAAAADQLLDLLSSTVVQPALALLHGYDFTESGRRRSVA